jgi:hypothetical protein
MMPTMIMRIAPPTPPPPTLARMLCISIPPPPAAADPITLCKMVPPRPASHNSCDGVSDRPQTLVFHRCAGNVSADRATDRFNNKASDVHRSTGSSEPCLKNIGLRAYSLVRVAQLERRASRRRLRAFRKSGSGSANLESSVCAVCRSE